MRNPKLVSIAVAAGVVTLAAAIIVAFSMYAGSDRAKTNLVAGYFRAVASGDPSAVTELTGPDFKSDFGVRPIARGNYELYDLGEPSPGVKRFILVSPGADGEKRAYIGELAYRRRGLVNRIDSVRSVEEGARMKE
ncbi:MAG: hypothetical protein KKA67_12885 [Spirochaetes bacterium]|nr:hypothetical protein [Spirochaetota bacterium]MBU1080344.1 hypothetical protein [Spirochaetota bacterium]